jgi:small redox-active disulfide protein 2
MMLAIKVLGPGCRKCYKLSQAVKKAADELNLAYTFEKVSEMVEIINHGVMNTPGLVIDGEVVVSGRVPSGRELTALLAPHVK